MNENIGVGLIVGLAIGTSLYIWNSDNFTKPQKIGLVCCIIFPPMQWGSILLVLAYNKYQSENTNEAKTVKQNFRNKQNLDSTINDLIELRGKGIISEEEFMSKVYTIENQKTEFDIKNSTEYKQLKNLFDSGILTKEEFESKIKLIKDASKKVVDPIENKKSVNPETEIFTKPKVENIKKDDSLKYYLIAIIFFVLLIGSVLLLSNTNEDNLKNNNNQPVVDKTSYRNYNLNQEPLNIETDNSSMIEIEQSISLFSDISGIYPKVTSFNEVKLIFGEPDFIDITKTEFDEISGKFIGGNKIVKYKNLGIELLFEREDTHMSAVDQILVKENFNAKSAEGIYIGMPEDKCRNILDSKYFKDFETDDYKSYTKKEGGISGLSIWFKDGKLDALAIH